VDEEKLSNGGALMPTYLQILLRTVFAFVFLFVICRILGKRQISQLTFFDYVTGITFGSITANLATDLHMSLFNIFESMATWGLLLMVVIALSLFFRPFRLLMDGKPTLLIENGKVLEKNLLKSKISLDELMLQLRQQSAFKLSDVELAVFETNGNISVLKKAEQSPVTPKQFGMTIESEKKPTVVINNGKPIQSAIDASGYTKGWLIGELSKKGIKDFSEVYAAQVDSKGQLYVDLVDDQKNNAMSNDRQAILAKIKKVAADLDVYALDTENFEAKSMYKEEAEKVKDLETKLKPYLQ
jgi:uncharacterized membrane protein YcaP (DUF421 family)